MAKHKKSRKASRKSNSKKGPKAWGKNLYGEQQDPVKEGIGGAAGMAGGGLAGYHLGGMALEPVKNVLAQFGIDVTPEQLEQIGWVLKGGGALGGGLAGGKFGKDVVDKKRKEYWREESVETNEQPVDEGLMGAAGMAGGGYLGYLLSQPGGKALYGALAPHIGNKPEQWEDVLKILTTGGGIVGGAYLGGKGGSKLDKERDDIWNASTEVKTAPITEQQAIAQFVKCLNEKNFALANKYLQTILEGKTRRRIAEQGQKYK